jgi:glycerol-3-phosphate dehydrogenase
MTNKAEKYIKRQTAHREVKAAKGDISQLIDEADCDVVAVPVGRLERIETALNNALVSLIGT